MNEIICMKRKQMKSQHFTTPFNPFYSFLQVVSSTEKFDDIAEICVQQFKVTTV